MGIWKKVGPLPYYKQSVILTLLVSIILLPLLATFFGFQKNFLMWLLLIIVILISSMRMYVTIFKTLVVTDQRVFFIQEVLPRVWAKLLGILPSWQLTELSRVNIVESAIRVTIIHNGLNKIKKGSIVMFMGFAGAFLITELSLKNIVPYKGFLLFIFLSVVFIALSIIVRGFFEMLPREHLIIQGKFYAITISHMTHAKKIYQILGQPTKSISF